MIKKEMIAMLLAGGQGSRLGVLTAKVAKPAVAFGGKYRIIDFPLSNCINSGIDTVGVLTQYQPLRLNTHMMLAHIHKETGLCEKVILAVLKAQADYLDDLWGDEEETGEEVNA